MTATPLTYSSYEEHVPLDGRAQRRLGVRTTTVPRKVQVSHAATNASRSTDDVVVDLSVARSYGTRAVQPMIDTSDDPTGAALVWPAVMLVLYALIALGILLVF